MSYVYFNIHLLFTCPGFGNMAIQTTIDGFNLFIPNFSSSFDSFGGTDYFNLRPTNSQNAGYYTAMAITFISPGGAEVGTEKLAFKYLNKIGKNILLTKAAQKAENAIGGVGKYAGTAKHTYAINLLKRHEKIYGNRGLNFNKYFNNGMGNSGFLDVIDHQPMTIYDFKFVML